MSWLKIYYSWEKWLLYVADLYIALKWDTYFSSNDSKRFEIPKILQIPGKICVVSPKTKSYANSKRQ